MDHKEAHHLRLYVLAALFFIVAAVYIGVLYDTQVNNYDYYYASSVRSIARSETVEAARGNITDRNGKVLVSSRSSYNLTFDASLLEKDEDANESLLRLLQLCQSRGINWVDSLPISRSAPFAYTIDSLDSAARSRFLTYLKDLDEAANALAAYLLEHPALLETTDEEGNRENPADDILADEELDQAGKAQALAGTADAQQHHGRGAEHVVSGQQADAKRCGAHEHQGRNQGFLTTEAVTEVAEQQAAERAGQKAHRKGDEGEQRGEHRVGLGDVGEENEAEVAGCGNGVTVVVVKLDGRADHGCDHDLKS